jgi:hypothetical protein
MYFTGLYLSQPQASGTLHLLVAWKVELVKLTEHEGLTIIHPLILLRLQIRYTILYMYFRYRHKRGVDYA